jgi:hypothetical protein
MTIQRLQAHYGFTRMPFGRDLAPGMLHRSRGHAEAVARIGWLVCERAIGVVTGQGSAPARPSPPAPPSPPSIRAGTRSSTRPTRPWVPEACTRRS